MNNVIVIIMAIIVFHRFPVRASMLASDDALNELQWSCIHYDMMNRIM